MKWSIFLDSITPEDGLVAEMYIESLINVLWNNSVALSFFTKFSILFFYFRIINFCFLTDYPLSFKLHKYLYQTFSVWILFTDLVHNTLVTNGMIYGYRLINYRDFLLFLVKLITQLSLMRMTARTNGRSVGLEWSTTPIRIDKNQLIYQSIRFLYRLIDINLHKNQIPRKVTIRQIIQFARYQS